jgi:hypothetical protein
MRFLSSWRLGRAGVIGVTVAMAAAGGFASPALAGPATAGGGVSATPASGTPQLAGTSTGENVRQLVKCGKTMYAVGKFTSISQGGSTFARNNAFSFSATPPYTVSPWNPSVNGTVNTIAFAGGDCSSAFIGGQFTQVGGTSVKNLAKVSTSTGAVNASFGHNAQAQVETMLVTGSHLLTGGYFTSINGTARSYYASLDVNTGKDDGYLALNISGHYSYPGVDSNVSRIYNQQLSPDGTRVLVEGDFTSVAGQSRQQIFMIDLGSGSATLDSWHPSIFNDNCSVKEPFYLQDAAWGQGAVASTIYAAGTGLHLTNWNGTFPLTGPCDAVTAVSATSGAMQWQNFTGCDSLFSVATDSTTVYIGGHERWANNENGCNHAGAGAVKAQGMAGFDITKGATLRTNGSGTAGLYSRARGLGADDMLRTSTGLWIASDNAQNVDKCQGVTGHAGLCFLPGS